MRCFTLAWSRCISWMLRKIGPPGIQNALHLLHKVVSLICTLITKYHFILSNLKRHNPQLGYWWRAWSRWMIWTSYSERGELGPLPTSPQSTCPGWRTRTRIGKPKEWSTQDWELRGEIVSPLLFDQCLWSEHERSSTSNCGGYKATIC